MRIEPHYKIQPVSPIYQIRNNPESQQQNPDYQKRNDLTTYQEKHTIDFLA